MTPMAPRKDMHHGRLGARRAIAAVLGSMGMLACAPADGTYALGRSR